MGPNDAPAGMFHTHKTGGGGHRKVRQAVTHRLRSATNMNLNPWTGSWLLATFAWSATAYGQQTDRTLSGGLEFRGDRWPVELAIERETDSEATPKATLSLPDLVYADEPAELRRDPAGVLTLKMPFGLGDYPLEALPDGGYFATAQLGGDTASLNLRLSSASLTRRQVEFPGDGVRL
jgi:hypothetical protein